MNIIKLKGSANSVKAVGYNHFDLVMMKCTIIIKIESKIFFNNIHI